MTDSVSKTVVAAILKDMTGRSGLGDMWEGIDEGIQAEIVAEWEGLTDRALIAGHDASYTLGAITITGPHALIDKILRGDYEETNRDITFTSVESSNVHSIGYNADTSELHIRFKAKGDPTHYTYTAVPSEVHEAMLRADSVGKYFAAFVKNKYEVTKVSA